MIEQDFIKVRQNVAQKLMSHISISNGQIISLKWHALLKEISNTYEILSFNEKYEKIQDNYMSLLIEVELVKVTSSVYKRKISSTNKKAIQDCISVGLQNDLVTYEQFENLSRGLREII